MDLTPWMSGLYRLDHLAEMNGAMKLVNEALQEDLEDQLDICRAQANSHIAKGESDAARVRKAINAKIDTDRKKDEEIIGDQNTVIELKDKVELKYREKLNSLKELESAILKRKIENEDKEDTSPEYKQTKLDNFMSTLWNQACEELLDAIYKKGSDNAKDMRLQMATSTFHYYSLQMELYYQSKSRAISELGTVLDLDDNAPLCKVIPDSLPFWEGENDSDFLHVLMSLSIDVENEILRENFDGSAALELCGLNYTENSNWLLALLSQSGSKFDFVKVTNKEGFSALKENFLTTLVNACVGCPDVILDEGIFLFPRYFSIGFCPSLDWESELFELFKPIKESMTINNRNNIVSGALGYVGDVKHKGEAMQIIVYFGFEDNKEPFKKINCFEMFRVPDLDNGTSVLAQALLRNVPSS